MKCLNTSLCALFTVCQQEKYCGEDPAPVPVRTAPLTNPWKPKAGPKKKTPKTEESRGVKRQATTPAKKPQKRQKTVSIDEESNAAPPDAPTKEDAPSDAESEPPKKQIRRKKKIVAEDSEDDEGAANGALSKANLDLKEVGDGEETPAVAPKDAKGDISESELSSLIDEPPVKRKRQKKSPSEKRVKGTKSKESKPAKAKSSKSKSTQDDDPDQAEIKRLQGWLVKCGIRKVWSKELAGCDTSKDKIRHLKAMLKDVGMEGKFSVEKAARIKEQREFAKDLEAIQEGERLWGKTEEGGNNGRPKRRAARATQKIVVEESEDDSGESEHRKESDEDQAGDDDEKDADDEDNEE